MIAGRFVKMPMPHLTELWSPRASDLPAWGQFL